MTAAAVVVILAAFCALMAWRSHRADTLAIDTIGNRHGVRRWEGEDNDHYMDRIKDRILITGGKSWR